MIRQPLEILKIFLKIKYLFHQFLKDLKVWFKTKKMILFKMFFLRKRIKISKKMMGLVTLISQKKMILRIFNLNLINNKSFVILVTLKKQNISHKQLRKISYLRQFKIKLIFFNQPQYKQLSFSFNKYNQSQSLH